ncbi:PDZ domain-containing protein [Haloechinothrix sp. LS1_15]|nr:PDZ domain-containing protein [Haloechinothrix sp. LS1_15]
MVCSALLVAVFGAVGATVSVPYVALGPGPIYDTLGEIDDEPVISVRDDDGEIVEDLVYDTTGSASLTTVSVADDVTMFNALARWVSGQFALAPREQYFRPGLTEEEIQEENIAQFEHSQDSAEVAALRLLGYPTGVYVQEVLPDEPAEDIVPPGAELLAVDGTELDSIHEVHDVLADRGPGEVVELDYRDEDGQEHSDTLELGAREDREQGFMGVTLTERAEVDFTIDIELADVGGPSAGIMFAVAIVDRMTEEDLLDGEHVAGSGEIAVTGEVGPIGGIGFKVDAARDAGVDAFLVPEQNCPEAVAADAGDMTLISVGTLEETIDALEAYTAGGDVPTCE